MAEILYRAGRMQIADADGHKGNEKGEDPWQASKSEEADNDQRHGRRYYSERSVVHARPPSVFSQAPQQAFAKSRTRRM